MIGGLKGSLVYTGRQATCGGADHGVDASLWQSLVQQPPMGQLVTTATTTFGRRWQQLLHHVGKVIIKFKGALTRTGGNNHFIVTFLAHVEFSGCIMVIAQHVCKAERVYPCCVKFVI